MKEVFIVTDLSFGDAGKGTTVDYLARRARTTAVIRHNGGPQAAHNVITPDGRHHTFSQFGSGSFVPGLETFLSRDMLVNPINMYPEASHLESLGLGDIWSRISVDSLAKVITPWHIAVNKIRETARGDARHGSCAQGIGETMADDLDWPELTMKTADIMSDKLLRRLDDMRRHKLDQALAIGRPQDSDEWMTLMDSDSVAETADQYRDWARRVRIVGVGYLATLVNKYEQIIFEGAQGVLLDEWYGFHPHTTWSTTTPLNARNQLADIDYRGDVKTLGIVRAYTTRHGAGPFPTEDPDLASRIPEYHNGTGEYQGSFRYGHFDAVLHRYAQQVSSVDGLVVTGLDRVADMGDWRVCDAYKTGDAGSGFFRYVGEKAVDVVLGPKHDLTYQEGLGRALSLVEPEYQIPATKTHIDRAEYIGELLDLPVDFLSHGPTALYKTELNGSLVKAA